MLPHLPQVKIVNADNGIIVQRSDFVTVRGVGISVQRPRWIGGAAECTAEGGMAPVLDASPAAFTFLAERGVAGHSLC